MLLLKKKHTEHACTFECTLTFGTLLLKKKSVRESGEVWGCCGGLGGGEGGDTAGADRARKGSGQCELCFLST